MLSPFRELLLDLLQAAFSIVCFIIHTAGTGFKFFRLEKAAQKVGSKRFMQTSLRRLPGANTMSPCCSNGGGSRRPVKDR